MSDQNKALTREIYEGVITQGQMDRLREIVEEDCFDHVAAAAGWTNGFQSHVEWFRGAFPDIVVQVNDMVAEDDRVVAYWSFTGTHQGEMFGFTGTGRKVSSNVISQLRWRDGKLVEYQVLPDNLSIMIQIGAIPDDNPLVQIAIAAQAKTTEP